MWRARSPRQSYRRLLLAAFVVVTLLLSSGARAAHAQARADSTKGFRATLDRVAAERARQKATARYDNYFKKYTKRYFGPVFDWRRFKAQGMAESELNPNAKSWVGARGIMQLMPTTFQAIQSKRPEFTAIDDPEWNIAAGIMHDRYLWKKWSSGIAEEDRHDFMFASYNAGEGTIGRACRAASAAQLDSARWASIERVAPSVTRWRYRETLGYVKKIQQNYSRIQNVR
jgi:membrane-bound lytic murein transglycosylase MltF